jgi:hypothetical protein
MLRMAAALVSSWNMLFVNFLINKNFCKEDLHGVKKGQQLCPHSSWTMSWIARPNGESEPFFSSGDLKKHLAGFLHTSPNPSQKSPRSCNKKNTKPTFNKFQGQSRSYNPKTFL